MLGLGLSCQLLVMMMMMLMLMYGHFSSLCLVSVLLLLATLNTHIQKQSFTAIVYLVSQQVFSNSEEAPINKKLPKELLLR